jgi:trimethylamine:corrinoid methyltransferase-like protein
VVDDEFFGMMFRILRGIRTDPEALATELITQIGYDASYLKSSHTLKNYEKEHHLARLFDKRFRGPWEAAGGRRVDEAAKERVRTLLSKHEPNPLDADIHRELERLVHEKSKAAGE